MAKTTAERQRDWRRRQAGNQSEVNRLTGELAAWKAEAKRWGQEQRAEIERLTDALEAAQACGVPRHAARAVASCLISARNVPVAAAGKMISREVSPVDVDTRQPMN